MMVFLQRSGNVIAMVTVWEKDAAEEEDEEEVGGLFKVKKTEKTERSLMNGMDCSKAPSLLSLSITDWEVEQVPLLYPVKLTGEGA